MYCSRVCVVSCDILHPSLCPVKKLPRNTPTSQQAGLRGRELHVQDTEAHKQVRSGVERDGERDWGRVEGGKK